MSDRILLFPSLTEERKQQIQFKAKGYTFFYIENENEYELEGVQDGDEQFHIQDMEGRWDPDVHNLGFRRKCLLKNFQCLFGEKGIACTDAQLGVAVIWTSLDSKQRGVVRAAEFGRASGIIEFEIEKLFLKAQMRGEIELRTVVHIAKAGHPTENERHLANTDGYILGELDRISFRVDGNGSVFPIYEVTAPGEPLWYVQCDWQDPTVERFSECISINLNKAHKNFKYIDRRLSSFNNQLMTEIMAAAISAVIEKARQSPYWEQIESNDDLENGSVGQAVFYFKETLGWDFTTPESVALSARRFFDQRM